MRAEEFHRVEDLFHRARELDPADRAGFLDRECGGALDLRAEIESLLVHSDRATEDVDVGRDREVTLTARPPVTEGPGTRIGPYKILQQIGEGGFGVVYMAEQERPVRRKVALKIIKLGMDTKQVIARFEAERQALAMMDHPSIARVLDAGATGTGRPYFVMELVRGIPITEYCDKNRLSTRDRLRLFVQVCRAVQHAHQKGIIHRDIKPSNVMVTLHDSTPVPKVIDFGIAKATSHRLTEKTLFTEYRQFIGTPEYMSPDQAEISGLDVDTRTDIFSLGVLLYELLTGTTPLDPRTLRNASYAQLQRMILEDDPPKPSTRLSTLAVSPREDDSLPDIARLRQTDPHSLSRLVRGDLDWIAMKAMEKDRTRRYATANELADDVERHLERQPVIAGPPSVAYKLRKFIQRHQVGVMASALVVAALLAGLSLSTIGFWRAEREAERSQAISDFLQQLLVAVDPQQAQVMDVSVEQVLARSRALFGENHAIVAGVLYSWAANLRVAGRSEEAADSFRKALDLYRRAYGPEHASVATALGALAEVLADQRDYEQAERLGREALTLQRRIHGDGSLQVALGLDRLTRGIKAADAGDRTAEIDELWARTVEAYRSAVGDDDPRTVTQLCEYGSWLFRRGKLEEADPILSEAVERGRRLDNQVDDTYCDAFISLVNVRAIQGDHQVTNQLFEELLELIAGWLGPENPLRVTAMTNYGMWLLRIHDLETAERVLLDAVSLARKILPEGDQTRLAALDALVKTYLNMGDSERTRPVYAEVIEEMRLCFGEDNTLFIESYATYGRWLHNNGIDDELAEAVTREAIALAEETVGAGNVAVAMGMEKLVDILEEKPGADPDEVRSVFVSFLDYAETVANLPTGFLDREKRRAAGWLAEHGYAAEAAPLYEELLRNQRAETPYDAEACADTLFRLGAINVKLGKPAEAEPLLRECLAIRQGSLGDGHWQTADARSVLGAALRDQGRYEEAEPLVLEAFAVMRDSLQTPESRRREALERILQLYEAWGRPDEAARWRP